MRKVKVLMLVAAVLAVMVSTTGTGYASTDDGRAEPAGSVKVLRGANGVACPAGYVCLYTGVDQTGSAFGWGAGQYEADFTKLFCQPGDGCYTNNDFNDEASSWHNNTNRKYCVSWGIRGGNPDNTMPPGTSGNFTTTGWNDQASSIGFIGCP